MGAELREKKADADHGRRPACGPRGRRSAMGDDNTLYIIVCVVKGFFLERKVGFDGDRRAKGIDMSDAATGTTRSVLRAGSGVRAAAPALGDDRLAGHLPRRRRAASKVWSRLSVDFSLPGQPGYETAKQLTEIYGANGTLGFTSIGVLTPPAGHSAARKPPRSTCRRTVQQAVPGSRVIDYANTHDAEVHRHELAHHCRADLQSAADVVLL